MIHSITQQVRARRRLDEIHARLTEEAGAIDRYLRFTPLELAAHFAERATRLRCEFCALAMEEEDFTFCPRVPWQRDGPPDLTNLALTCVSCSAAKGMLDHVEFRELWRVMVHWPKPIVRDVLERLCRPSRLQLPEVGDFEWFR